MVLCCAWAAFTYAGTCDPQNGVSVIGIEAAATSDQHADGTFDYNYSLLSCDSGSLTVTEWNSTSYTATPYSMYQTVVQQPLNMHRLFASACGSHIIILHDNYTGLLNGVGPNPTSIPGMLYLPKPTSKCYRGAANTIDSTIAVNNACPKCALFGAPGAADPINAGTGDHFQRQVDWAAPAPSPLTIARYYNSLDGSGSMGAGWHHQYDDQLTPYVPDPVPVDTPELTILQDGSSLSGSPTAPAIPAPPAPTTPAGNDPSQGQTPPPMTLLALHDGRVIGFPPYGGNDLHGLGYKLMFGGAIWTLTLPDDTTETFSDPSPGGPKPGSVFHLQSIRFRNGVTLTFTYGSSAQLTTVTDSFGNTLSYAYANNRLVSIATPAGHGYSYSYDSHGNLASVTNPDASTRQYLYENTSWTHLLTGITDENGGRYASWRFDSQGRATNNQLAGGVNSTTVSYNSLGQSTVTDAVGLTQQYGMQTINNRMLLNSLQQSCTGCTTLTYALGFDGSGNITQRTDFNGSQTSYVIDTARNLETSRTEAAGTPQARTIATVWHANFHLPTQITDPVRVTNLSYDSSGNLTQKTVTANSQTRSWSWTYGNFGLVSSATDPVGNVTSYGYDVLGHLTTFTNALGQITRFSSYDGDGNLLGYTDPSGLTTTLGYDALGRLTSRQQSTELTSFSYDSVGQLTHVTLPDGSGITYSYDAAHRLTGIADSLGNTISYTLDLMGRRTRTDSSDPAGQLAISLQQVQTQRGASAPAQP
ncbi:DUF6531 domain-containing protein [Andreprevotia chitinilytica]|uniref:DUF6531 domain-containing protein n=1 Tax=Andreprevotia chitinilytica TaxID=396808 RepID=UPI00068F3C81|nr:DUF6531 domain-containing protein [Andreprevotia chitinilytica]